MQISGSEMESSLTPAERLQGSGSANPLVCETWTVYQRHAKRLNHFHLSCLKKFFEWQDKIPDTEVLEKAGMQNMHTVLKLAQRM